MWSLAAVLSFFLFFALRAKNEKQSVKVKYIAAGILSLTKLRPEVPPEPVEGLAEGGRQNCFSNVNCVTCCSPNPQLPSPARSALVLAQRAQCPAVALDAHEDQIAHRNHDAHKQH